MSDCCENHEPGIAALNRYILFCHFQSAAPKTTFPEFKFCPWCGEKIVKNTTNTREVDKAAPSK